MEEDEEEEEEEEPADIMSMDAMNNAYYICHNVQVRIVLCNPKYKRIWLQTSIECCGAVDKDVLKFNNI